MLTTVLLFGATMAAQVQTANQVNLDQLNESQNAALKNLNTQGLCIVGDACYRVSILLQVCWTMTDAFDIYSAGAAEYVTKKCGILLTIVITNYYCR